MGARTGAISEAGRLMDPFFTFYGGKWRAATRYPRPLYPTVVEPFAGAAGYSVRYEPETVLLNDIDPTLSALWLWLATRSASDIENLPLLDLAAGQSTLSLDIPPEARDLIGFWINKGTERPFRSPSKWVRSGIRPKSSWGPEVRSRIASQVGRIHHWEIKHGDYLSLPDIEATWFIDPPYAGHAGGRYVWGNRLLDYVELGEWCRSRRGQVIVCENAGATWLPFEPLGSVKTSRTRRSDEVVWLGGAQ